MLHIVDHNNYGNSAHYVQEKVAFNVGQANLTQIFLPVRVLQVTLDSQVMVLGLLFDLALFLAAATPGTILLKLVKLPVFVLDLHEEYEQDVKNCYELQENLEG